MVDNCDDLSVNGFSSKAHALMIPKVPSAAEYDYRLIVKIVKVCQAVLDTQDLSTDP